MILDQDPIASIGTQYEQSLSDRRQTGVFYTPRVIASHLASESIQLWDTEKLAQVKVLDPACGCGILFDQTPLED